MILGNQDVAFMIVEFFKLPRLLSFEQQKGKSVHLRHIEVIAEVLTHLKPSVH